MQLMGDDLRSVFSVLVSERSNEIVSCELSGINFDTVWSMSIK